MKLSMSKTRLTICLLLISLLAMPLSGCSRSQKDAYYYVTQIISEHPSMPSGRFYGKGKKDDGISILPLDGYLAFSLYGDSSLDIVLGEATASDDLYPEEFELVKDFCVWLGSTLEPYEISVFKLRSSSDSTAVAKMLIRRLDKLKKYWRESQYYADIESCAVRIEGDLVILEILPESNIQTQ